jgi:hypothetical protein
MSTSSVERNIKDTISLEFKGIDFPIYAINQRFFETNTIAVYQNYTSNNLHELNEFERNNRRRRDDLDMLLSLSQTALDSIKPVKKMPTHQI